MRRTQLPQAGAPRGALGSRPLGLRASLAGLRLTDVPAPALRLRWLGRRRGPYFRREAFERAAGLRANLTTGLAIAAFSRSEMATMRKGPCPAGAVCHPAGRQRRALRAVAAMVLPFRSRQQPRCGRAEAHEVDYRASPAVSPFLLDGQAPATARSGISADEPQRRCRPRIGRRCGARGTVRSTVLNLNRFCSELGWRYRWRHAFAVPRRPVAS